MNTDKEFVPYQQSLDMKEIGFDEPCFGYYNGQGNYIGEEGKMNSYCNKLGMHGAYCTAPTYSQAFRFFREKYKIRFIIQSSMSDLGEFFKVIFPNGEQRGVSYNTYEEAELECLVKLIDIVKKQNLKG
jgi:hypothetical protein